MHDLERGTPSSLRGWLSEVYLTALVQGGAEHLARRLGDRGTVDDPLFGRKTGEALAPALAEMATWLGKRAATFDKVAFALGSDRDVTEGTLSLHLETGRVALPVAVVAERRKEREVEVRLYYSAKLVEGKRRAPRSPLMPDGGDVGVPPPIEAHLQALARGDVAGLLASFQNGASLRDSAGVAHARGDDGGAMRTFYERLFSSAEDATKAGIEVIKGARADDGRACALEYTVVRVNGKSVPPQAGFAVYERGESGLLRAVRIYEDIDEM